MNGKGSGGARPYKRYSRTQMIWDWMADWWPWPQRDALPPAADWGKQGGASVTSGTSLGQLRPISRIGPGSGFSWYSAVLIAIPLAVLFVLLAPQQTLDRILQKPQITVPLRPDVLVVSSAAMDHEVAVQTVRPRGYVVRSTTDVASGLKSLQRDPERIGIVVLDTDLPAASQMAAELRKRCPDAKLLTVRGTRSAERLSSMLIDAGLR